jgi:hypothetical protein
MFAQCTGTDVEVRLLRGDAKQRRPTTKPLPAANRCLIRTRFARSSDFRDSATMPGTRITVPMIKP